MALHVEMASYLKRETELSKPKGVLHLLGGASSDELEYDMVPKDEAARILVATLAGSEPQSTARNYKNFFLECGFRNVYPLYREDFSAEDPTSLLDDVDIVHFTGGDQALITKYTANTEFKKKLQEKFRQGMKVAGISAGASAMGELSPYSEYPIEVGTTEGSLFVLENGFNLKRSSSNDRIDSLFPGLALLPSTIIDNHFNNQDFLDSRIERMLAAVEIFPDFLGIGIDEQTGLIVENGGELSTVRGHSKVHFFAHASKLETTTNRAFKPLGNDLFYLSLNNGSSINLETLELSQKPCLH